MCGLLSAILGIFKTVEPAESEKASVQSIIETYTNLIKGLPRLGTLNTAIMDDLTRGGRPVLSTKLELYKQYHSQVKIFLTQSECLIGCLKLIAVWDEPLGTSSHISAT